MSDKVVKACLAKIVNDVSRDRGVPAEDIQRLLDLAQYVGGLAEASNKGILALPPSNRPN